MTTHQKFVWVVAVLTGVLLVNHSAAAQAVKAEGWPDATPAKVADPAVKPAAAVNTAPAAVKAVARTKPVVKKPADAPKPAASKTVAVAMPATVATPAPAAAAPSAPVSAAASPARKETAAAPVAAVSVAPVALASDLVQALQQQSQVLTRLATELETQRQVIANQQQAIKTLETRAAATSSPAAAVPAPKAPAAASPIVLVDTNGAKLKMGGLVQGWFTTGTGAIDTFRLRRTELKLSGEIGARAKWTVMFDPAKSLGVSNTYVTVNGFRVVSDTAIGQGGKVLQDAFLSLMYSPQLTVELGQQKIPLSMEGVQSSGKLDTAERALFMADKARGGGFGDVRDMGVLARGKLVSGQVEYAGGFFNGMGESMNDVDKNDEKPFVGRLVIKPKAVKGLQFGGSMARASSSNDATRRDRSGFEAAYTRGIFTAKSELMLAQDGAVTRQGYYLFGGAKLSKSIEAVFRHDVFDPDTRSDATAATVTERDWLGGVNWFIAGPSVVLQFDYVRKTFASVQAPRDVFITNLQTSW